MLAGTMTKANIIMWGRIGVCGVRPSLFTGELCPPWRMKMVLLMSVIEAFTADRKEVGLFDVN
jgi:hypothetical protein